MAIELLIKFKRNNGAEKVLENIETLKSLV